MSVFDLSETLESINGGAVRYDLQQVIPVSGMINNASIGTGQASGLVQYIWEDQEMWWSPVNSYFHMQLEFYEAGAIGMVRPVTYCDNFPMAMFTQIQSYVDSRPLDTVNTPWIIDTALTYSAAHNNFLKTWGSMTRVGEPLTTRLRNVNKIQSSIDGTNSSCGTIEVVFRPCISLFDVKLLPPGAQFKINFNFASSALACFESLIGSISIGTGADQFDIKIKSFSFYKAVIQPGNNIQMPAHGVIDLCPAIANQYFLNAGQTLKQNLTLPGTTNRLLVVFQDTNTTSTVTIAAPVTDKICGVGNGYNPVTSFTNIFTTTAAADATFSGNTCRLDQLWINLPELAYSAPQPIYAFANVGTDLTRAYSDFCHIVQGTKDQMEGSIPFGEWHTQHGTTIIHLDTSTAANFIQLGDPNNPQQYPYYTASGAGAPSANSYNQTSRWGWSGRCPGPIFAFPVVRPEGKMITCGTLNFTTAALGGAVAQPINLGVTVIASYSMALVVEYDQSRNKYKYQLVDGI